MLERILQSRIVVIMRGDYRGRWLDYAEALLDGGLSTVEITMNSPDALTGITTLQAHYGDRLTLGAGTVLTANDVHAARDAGARFIVAPDTDEAVIAACKAHNLVTIPGAYTPTEVKRAYRLGADIVKLFPAQSAAFVKAVHAPLPHIPLMATGGINADNAAAFLQAGSTALGVGSSLTNPDLGPDEVRARTAALAAIAGENPMA